MTVRRRRQRPPRTLAELAERLEALGLGGLAEVIAEELLASRETIHADATIRANIDTGEMKASIKQGGTAAFQRVSAGSRKVKYAFKQDLFTSFLRGPADDEAPKLQARLGKRIDGVLNNG